MKYFLLGIMSLTIAACSIAPAPDNRIQVVVIEGSPIAINLTVTETLRDVRLYITHSGDASAISRPFHCIDMISIRNTIVCRRHELPVGRYEISVKASSDLNVRVSYDSD